MPRKTAETARHFYSICNLTRPTRNGNDFFVNFNFNSVVEESALFSMAGKRGATSDLNHDNWDQEEEREEAGAWKEAGKDVLKERVIRKAKRRGVAKTVSE